MYDYSRADIYQNSLPKKSLRVSMPPKHQNSNHGGQRRPIKHKLYKAPRTPSVFPSPSSQFHTYSVGGTLGHRTSSHVSCSATHPWILSTSHPAMFPFPGTGFPTFIDSPKAQTPSPNENWKHFPSASHALRQCSKLKCASRSSAVVFFSSGTTFFFFPPSCVVFR